MLVEDRVTATTKTVCDSFGPGHQLHWMHWKRASSAPSIPVSRVVQDGTTLELFVPGRAPLRWHHHDADRLGRALAAAELPILACPEWQALRVDGFWFNCATSDDLFDDCHWAPVPRTAQPLVGAAV